MRLALIAMGKSAGFSLDQIAVLLGGSGVPALPRDVIHARADEIDRKIRALTALRDTLRHVADCPAPSHMECPTFWRMVAVAGKRGGRRKVAVK